jgi:hypothetical protein
MRTLRVVALFAGIAGLWGCTKSPSNALPTEIQGHWVTQSPGYQERYLQLEKDFVLIGVAQDETPSIQRVYRVETEGNGRQMTYKIYSTGAESDFTLTIYFDPANGGEIKVKNQPGIVWKRADPSQIP